MRLDHLAIACRDLWAGCDWAQAALGVPFGPGGRHARFGTHNRLLGLGPDLYLEVIAPDPDAAPFEGPRWFGLDTPPPVPRLANWIVAVADMDAARAVADPDTGPPIDLARGDLTWRLTVPKDGHLPHGGGAPTLIEWGAGSRHPAATLPDSGVRLRRLEVMHPDADALRDRYVPLRADPRIAWVTGAVPGLRATFDTPDGPRSL